MNILYIGTPKTYTLYKEGKNPSHWLYGAVEMEQDGHTVYWENESKTLFNDLKLLKSKKPNMLFIPNLNIRCHLLLLLLKSLGIIRNPLYAYIHHSPQAGNRLKGLFHKFLLRGINHSFFLSEKSMREAIEGGFIKKGKCSVPGWGADMNFFSRHTTTKNSGYFVSTGKENRDFKRLIEAFSATDEKLRIITCGTHAGRDYSDLNDISKQFPNIEVIITENSGEVYPRMLKEMSQAKALVCPLIKENLTYCVGLSTIADAEGLGKPLIITDNPYHEKERTAKFNVVQSTDNWIKAIKNLKTTNGENTYSMSNCYENMKRVMFKKEKN